MLDKQKRKEYVFNDNYPGSKFQLKRRYPEVSLLAPQQFTMRPSHITKAMIENWFEEIE